MKHLTNFEVTIDSDGEGLARSFLRVLSLIQSEAVSQQRSTFSYDDDPEGSGKRKPTVFAPLRTQVRSYKKVVDGSHSPSARLDNALAGSLVCACACLAVAVLCHVARTVMSMVLVLG